MSLPINLDQMFDLDLALTTPPSTTSENSSNDDYANATKLPEEESNDASKKQNQQVELPTVSATGLCTVCMEGFESSTGRGKRVPCGHVFHANCIDKWLSVQHSCPLCRFSVCASAHVFPGTSS
ncbi:hypothetical protein ACH5RR_006046 [Cinchona calisaya]|uniref:RING-type domain-containing protein n=1 Tax=Cinchona calisaya TaxID=153742 RepID=A0ABD3AMW3_9GENT